VSKIGSAGANPPSFFFWRGLGYACAFAAVKRLVSEKLCGEDERCCADVYRAVKGGSVRIKQRAGCDDSAG